MAAAWRCVASSSLVFARAGEEVCAAWLRGESALVALACEVVGRCEVRAALGAGQLAARTHVARPPPLWRWASSDEREKCARAEEGGAWQREPEGEERCWSLRDEKGGVRPLRFAAAV